MQAIVGATGLAVLDGESLGSWIAKRTALLPMTANLDSLLDALREASGALARVAASDRKYRHLTFVVGAIQGSQSVIALLSNYQNMRGYFIADDAVPGFDLRLDVTRPSNPRLVVAGQVQSIRKEERKALERLLRGGSPPDVVRERMAELNKRAAGRTDFVTEGCYAATELATGQGFTQPFLVEQVGDFMPPDVEEMLMQAGIKLNRASLPDGSRAPLQLRGATSAGYSPSPAYFREQFKLRPDDSELWNNFGAYEGAQDRTAEACAAYEKALELDPENFIAARNLGILLWRVYGDGERGRHWLDVALRHPDENQRRETLSLLADTLLFEDCDVSAAGRYYEESIGGEMLPAVSARWGYFVLHYDLDRADEAEHVIDRIIEREPNYSLAIVGKAECLWRLHGDLPGARELVRNALDQSPKDALLLSSALRFSLTAGEIDLADDLLRRLTREKGKSSAVVVSFQGLLCLCRGADLREAEDLFREAGGQANLVNLAAVQWAQGRHEECRGTMDHVNLAALSVDARAELTAIRFLVDECTPKIVSQEVVKGLSDLHFGLDPTMLRALSNHADVAEESRSRIADVLGEIATVDRSS